LFTRLKCLIVFLTAALTATSAFGQASPCDPIPDPAGHRPPDKLEMKAMAKGQKKSNKEIRKPKTAKVKAAPTAELCSSELQWDPWAYDVKPDESREPVYGAGASQWDTIPPSAPVQTEIPERYRAMSGEELARRLATAKARLGSRLVGSCRGTLRVSLRAWSPGPYRDRLRDRLWVRPWAKLASRRCGRPSASSLRYDDARRCLPCDRDAICGW